MATSVLTGMIERTLQEALSYGIGGALTPTLEPLSQAVRNRVWPLDPNLPLDAGTSAILVVEGLWTPAQGAAEAAMGGIDAARFAALVDVADVAPGLSELLELRRRGLLDAAATEHGLAKLHLEERYRAPLLELSRMLLSAADLAMARQQGFVTDAEQRQRAALVGVDADDADLLYELAGLPPGVGEALDLLRRGLIDEARFAQIVREGHTKTKYTDDLLALRWQPLSAAIAAEALIRERMSESDAVAIAEQNGIRRDDFLQWSAMLGRPMPIGESLTLVNRGQMTQAEFREVVARSDIRTEYTDHLLQLRFKYPPLFQVMRAIQNGTIDDDLARDTLTKEGYTPAWVDAIVGAGHKEKTTTHKHVALSVIETLYDAGFEDEEHTQTAIVALGYSPADAADLLLLHEARRTIAELSRAANIVRAKYVNHQIDELTARADLDKLGLKSATKERLLRVWTVERAANVRRLTPAQIGQAFKYEIFTEEQAIARWVQLGYSQADAEVYAAIVAKGPLHPPAVTDHASVIQTAAAATSPALPPLPAEPAAEAG